MGCDAYQVDWRFVRGVRRYLLYLRWAVLLLFLLALMPAASGCRSLYYGQVGFVQAPSAPGGFSQDKNWVIFFKTTYFYPVREALDLPLQLSRLSGKPISAKDLDDNGTVPPSSFFTPRDIGRITPEALELGPHPELAPQPPYRILKVKTSGGTPGFLGEDASGARFLFKMDDPNHPGLASGAEMVASRIYWALGYLVPQNYLVTITGTGDPRYEGRRAIASKIIDGKVLGLWKMDWVRDRREFRSLRLAAAWLNDVDRSDNNNLAVERDGLVWCYMLDFNAALGSWQGRPKEPWQGCRHRWDVEDQFWTLLTLGLGRRTCRSCDAIDFKSLGYIQLCFEPERWRGEKPNTAFDRMTPEDARWMAQRIAAFSPEQLRAIVNAAGLPNARDRANLLEALVLRQQAVVQTYWARPEQ
jgi:hypothetical protein